MLQTTPWPLHKITCTSDNLNSVIQFCQENGKATRSSRCCNWCQTSDTPSYDQDIVMHPTEFYRMSMKEHIATSNSRQKSSVNLDVTQHIWRKRPATKILNILLATRGKPRVHRTPSLLATKQDCAPGTHSITSHWRIVYQSIHHPTSYRAFTKQHLAKMVTAFEKEGSPMLGPSG